MSNKQPLDFFLESVKKQPNEIAVQSKGISYSYHELDCLSDQIAQNILLLNPTKPFRVGIYLEKSARIMAAILGIWKAGGAYVPLEKSIPDDRRNFIVKSCQLFGMITCKVENGVETEQIIFPDLSKVAPSSSKLSSIPGSNEDLAYIIYTSGSTGNPKGVMINNASLTELILWCNRSFAHLHDQKNILNVANFSFDQSVLDIAFFLAQGKMLYILDNPENILEIPLIIASHKINIISTVPHVLGVLCHSEKLVKRFDLSSLSTIFGGGAVFPPSTVPKLQSLLGNHVEIYNIYGPTEATVYCFLHRLDTIDSEKLLSFPIPIGRPFDNMDGLILDSQNRPLPPGELGILALKGPQLMVGYWGMDDTNQKVLIPDPMGGQGSVYLTGDLAYVDESGIFHFKGRQDDTIKVAGYRIDLGDITHNLLRNPNIEEAAVVAMPDPLLENKTRAFVKVKNGSLLTEKEILLDLEERLPHYFMPHEITMTDYLPKSNAGKIDTNKLKQIMA
ncbi:MAG: amino acid adenylation domain-containing protein [Magnetococcales bacterium]|nr:amino acid adenylation domain-containing protein [Magnetococcales bacterium]